jgi:hypothetical protein
MVMIHLVFSFVLSPLTPTHCPSASAFKCYSLLSILMTGKLMAWIL